MFNLKASSKKKSAIFVLKVGKKQAFVDIFCKCFFLFVSKCKVLAVDATKWNSAQSSAQQKVNIAEAAWIRAVAMHKHRKKPTKNVFLSRQKNQYHCLTD